MGLVACAGEGAGLVAQPGCKEGWASSWLQVRGGSSSSAWLQVRGRASSWLQVRGGASTCSSAWLQASVRLGGVSTAAICHEFNVNIS